MSAGHTQVGSRTGEVAASISNAAVKLLSQYTGRGPTKVRTTIAGRWVFITLEDSLTHGERQLAAHGYGESVLRTRREFQSIMREEYEAAVELATGRRVLAFMSDNHLDPDVAVEAFLLADEEIIPPVPPTGTAVADA